MRRALGPSVSLRQRMLHFTQNLHYYVMSEVLEPRWAELTARLRDVSTVDEVLRLHASFQDACLQECLLSDHALLKTLAKILSTCLLFSGFLCRIF